MLLFGLTGGIASGKSTVAARLRELGVPVIDADQLAREVVAPGSEGLAAVVAAFGEGVLAEDGALDRKALAAVAFADPARRRQLNAILHPRIAALTMQRSAALAARGEPVACYEAALLVENGLADAFRPLVVVAVPEDVQVARAMARDGSTEADARARIAAQLPLADKVNVADHVIDNAGSIEATRRRTDDVLRAIRAAAGLEPPSKPEGA
ncbi:MAG TPA: dephospho-CoA kinase [Minicystis sp.]|nr:dephospho-CoA kinase [Minicystis sp.]